MIVQRLRGKPFFVFGGDEAFRFTVLRRLLDFVIFGIVGVVKAVGPGIGLLLCWGRSILAFVSSVCSCSSVLAFSVPFSLP